MKLLSLLVTAFVLFGSYSAPVFGQCAQCANDNDPGTNCIETKLEVASMQTNAICYRLIVFNHQFSGNSNPLCAQYNTERYLTMELENPACYDTVTMNVTPVKANTWVYDLGGTTYSSYNNAFGHPTKLTWRRDSATAPPAPNFARCEIDTFLICFNCTHKAMDSVCANGGFDLKVYFSNANGDPTCVDETGPPTGRNFERVKVRPPLCNMTSCGTCQFYGSTCNSWDVTFGCDYIDITIKNDHSYPVCGPIRRVEFWIGGVPICDTNKLPKFRDWTTTQGRYDTMQKRTYYTFTSPNQGIRPCDSFKLRIPFCCTKQDTTVYIQLGEGFCTNWGSGSSDGSAPPRIYHTFPKLNCPDCYLDKDEAKLTEGLPGACDTLTICNKNTSNTECGGSNGTGNTKFDKVVIDVGTQCTIVGVLPPHGTNGWAAIIPPTPPSTVWVFQGPPIEPCDCIRFLLCGCLNVGVVKWITMTSGGDTITVDSTGGWGEEPWPGSTPKQATPETPIIGNASSISSSVVASVGEPVPNPTTGLTTIPLTLAAGSGPALVSIYGSDGNLVGTKQQNIRIGLNELQIDGSGWPSGSHRVRVQIGETVMNKVFILRR